MIVKKFGSVNILMKSENGKIFFHNCYLRKEVDLNEYRDATRLCNKLNHNIILKEMGVR